MNKIYNLIILILFLIFMSSCSGNNNSQNPNVQTSQQNKKQVQQYEKSENSNDKKQKKNNNKSNKKDEKEKKSLGIKETFDYKNMGKRDPFEIPLTEKDITEPQGTGVQDEGYEFNFSQFKYKGLIKLLDSSIALIEDDSGKGIRLKEGDSFGGAVVVEINKNEVILEKQPKEKKGSPKQIILEKIESKGGK